MRPITVVSLLVIYGQSGSDDAEGENDVVPARNAAAVVILARLGPKKGQLPISPL